jgi:hypothetical protein
MFGIAALEFFFDLAIGVFPETPKVLGNLYRPLGRREKMYGHRDPPHCNHRVFFTGKHLLDAYL